MRYSEWIAFGYFIYLASACWMRRLPRLRCVLVTAVSLATSVAIVLVARRGTGVVRDWAPLMSILVGYYVPGWLFVRPSARAEAWLLGWDRRLLADPTTRFSHWPRWLLAYLEIVYAGCFLLLPAGLAVLVSTGYGALADRYWSMVAISELGSFGPLVFVQSRPPWALERPAALPDDAVHRAAFRIVRSITTGANTFPSGHTAGSLAIAFALLGKVPIAGALFLLMAISIAVACVVGRYHYIVDVAAGAALALIAWSAVWVVGV